MRCHMQLRRILLLIETVMLLLICSCARENSNHKIQISPLDKSLLDLASQVYDEAQLLDIANFSGSLHELNTKYPIDCIRKSNEFYRVSYLGTGSITTILFDKYGNKLLSSVHDISLLKSDFDAVLVGQSLDEIQKIDPNGEYLFLYTGSNDAPAISSHYTNDGYLVSIEYDKSNTVIRVTVELV